MNQRNIQHSNKAIIFLKGCSSTGVRQPFSTDPPTPTQHTHRKGGGSLQSPCKFEKEPL